MSASCARDEAKSDKKTPQQAAKTPQQISQEKARINALLDAPPSKLTDPSKRLKPAALPPATAVGAKGERVETIVVGVAKNAKSGAIVDRDGTVYYVAGLAEWPDKVAGKRVEVTGTLGQAKLAPDPVVGKDGAVSAGMKGTSTVLSNPTWKLAP